MPIEVIRVKVNQTEVRNQFHFDIQRNFRINIHRNRKKYTRKQKHRNQTEY